MWPVPPGPRKALSGCPPTTGPVPPGRGLSGETQPASALEKYHDFVLFKVTDLKNRPHPLTSCSFFYTNQGGKALGGNTWERGARTGLSGSSRLPANHRNPATAPRVSEFCWEWGGGWEISFSIQPLMSMTSPFLLPIPPYTSRLSETLGGL